MLRKYVVLPLAALLSVLSALYALASDFTNTYTTSQSSAVVVTVAPGQFLSLTGFAYTLSKNTTVVTGFVLKCDDTVDREIDGHPGVAPGSGYVRIQNAEHPITNCADGQDLLMDMDDPGASGKARLTINYEMFNS